MLETVTGRFRSQKRRGFAHHAHGFRNSLPTLILVENASAAFQLRFDLSSQRVTDKFADFFHDRIIKLILHVRAFLASREQAGVGKLFQMLGHVCDLLICRGDNLTHIHLAVAHQRMENR